MRHSINFATGWTAVFRFPADATDSGSTPALGSIQPPIQWVPGPLSPAVKRPGREADHSPPSSVEVKNGGAMPPLSHTSS
jgi:hypothetical protein